MATDAFQKDVREIGERIFSSMEGQSPSIFNKEWWSGRIMEWSMKDESFKVDMFRFVDVLPVLKTSEQVAQHLREYFARPGQETPAFVKAAVGAAGLGSIAGKLAAGTIKKNVQEMAERFIVGTTGKEALPTLASLRKEKVTFTVDLLGEATVSEEEALTYQKRYLEILDSLVAEAPKWPAVEQIDGAPRINLSVKITALYSQIDPIDWDGSIRATKERLRPIFARAKQAGAFVNVDMEQYRFKDLTYAIFKSLLEEPEFADWAHAGIVVQAYLKEAEQDARDLIAWSAKRKSPITVRLVKGAYWDYETVLAEQRGWPCPVFEHKWETDQSFERIATMLIEARPKIRVAIGSHNIRSIAHAMATAKRVGAPPREVEYQMLFGMAEPVRAALVKMGERVRVYAPVGELLPGMAYLVRRLLENTSNESFLRRGFAEGVSHDQLLAAPNGNGATGAKPLPARAKVFGAVGPFVNEAHADFSKEEVRAAMRDGLAQSRKLFSKTWPLHVGGKDVTTSRVVDSLNPAKPAEVVGRICQASREEAELAMRAAKAAFPAWRDESPAVRADYLIRAAAEMRRRKWLLSATMVHEVGKTWREADADTGEAIDFCEYYAREMIRLGRHFNPRRLGAVPGEANELFYQARGVGIVISPWNFPLAILTGMTIAAIAAGNCVLIKPAEPSQVIAAQLMDVLKFVKLPAGVANFVPGKGSDVGQYLVEHPDTAFIAFTGSKEVGLGIMKSAAEVKKGQRQVKRVIAEMGGKNAIIVDGDADLDEAVTGVVQSAFGFQGQKCSACSRAIVLEENYDEFVHRVIESVRSLEIGPPESPAYAVGPVVDAKSQKKILEYVEIAKKEGKIAISREIPADRAQGGYYVGPTVVVDLKPDAVVACEEIFGPVLAVLKAKSFDEALDIAVDGVEFALTGGVFSRSPANLAKARERFRVGNLYLNRGITGALVERQPFGGFAMSGVGSKAGGPDYLLQFLEPRSITENTLRRGFAPPEESDAGGE